MGHYASEMHLDSKPSLSPSPALTGSQDTWVVDDLFQPVTTAEYYARKNKFGMGAYALLSAKVFKSKERAKQHAVKLVQQKIRNTELQLSSLREQLESLSTPK